ncbi:hypothetical protein [Marinimicrobium sp. ABcell2]|uniref:hypothetical protein n=1 Tax=Marinimicrobium sp. ABcell2 TaxID=3069751 RepID=UPI0027B6D6BC|nr:hypothetical protein [Marinimicrobium sp. ABcell2]MDQ2078521.1 hypothetical protein [Marinimicrobium sp. ABcell2]
MPHASLRVESLPVELEQSNSKPPVNRRLGFSFAVSVLAHGLLFIWLYGRIAVPTGVPATVNPAPTFQIRMRNPAAEAPEALTQEVEEPTAAELPASSVEPPDPKPTPNTEVISQVLPEEAEVPVSSPRRPLVINSEDLRVDAPNAHETPSRNNVFNPAMRSKLDSARATRPSTQPTEFEQQNNRAAPGGDMYMSFDDKCFVVGESFAGGRRENSWHRIGCTGASTESEDILERVNQRVRARE